MEERQIIDILAGRRRQLNITQEDLGKRVGMSRNNICRIENHRIKPPLEVIVAICHALDYEIEVKEKPTRD